MIIYSAELKYINQSSCTHEQSKVPLHPFVAISELAIEIVDVW